MMAAVSTVRVINQPEDVPDRALVFTSSFLSQLLPLLLRDLTPRLYKLIVGFESLEALVHDLVILAEVVLADIHDLRDGAFKRNR